MSLGGSAGESDVHRCPGTNLCGLLAAAAVVGGLARRAVRTFSLWR